VASNTYTYTVTAVFRSWSSGATSTNVIVPAPVLTSLNLDLITPTRLRALTRALASLPTTNTERSSLATTVRSASASWVRSTRPTDGPQLH